MKATPEITEKTTVRFIVQWLAKGQWRTHDPRYINDQAAGGVYTTVEKAKWHFEIEAPHRAPGTLRIVKSTIVSTWEEVL